MRSGVGPCVLALLCLHSSIFGQREPTAEAGSGVLIFCDDQSVEKAVHSAVHKFNERLTTGNKLVLYQILTAQKSESGSDSVYTLQFTSKKSDCQVGSDSPWTNCGYMSKDTEPISCHATVLMTETEAKTTEVDCKIDDYVFSSKAPCLGCPEEIDQNSEDLKGPLSASISKYNSMSDSTHLFSLHNVGQSTRQVVAGFRYKLRFNLKKTTCTKEEHKDLNDLCVHDDQNEEYVNCNSTVDVAPWRHEAPQAHLECEPGLMVFPKRRPPGWTPLRNLMTDSQASEDIDVNSENLNRPLSASISKYNSMSDSTHLFNLHNVGQASRQSVAGLRYKLRFGLKKTTCTKKEHHNLNDLCVADDQNEEYVNCNSTVDVAALTHMPSQAQLECESGPLLMVVPRRRPLGWTPLRNFMMEADSTHASEDIDPNSEELKGLLSASISKYNSMSDSTHLFSLHKVGQASRKVVTHFKYQLRFDLKKTTCTKKEHKDLNDLCVPDDQNEEYVNCNATVDVAALTHMPSQAQLECESGPLLMVSRKRPPGWTPLRGFMTDSTQASEDIDVNSEKLKRPLSASISKYNSMSDSTHLFNLHKVGQASRQSVAGLKYELRFDLKKTTCTKEEHKDLNDLCVHDDQNEEYVNCNATVDVAALTHMPSQAQLECESGPLLMVFSKKRPPGWTPLRNLMTDSTHTSNDIDPNSEELKGLLSTSISKYNSMSDSTHLFSLHKVGQASRQATAHFKYQLRFDLKKTTCAKEEHKDLNDLCVPDDQNEEYVNCNSTVDVAALTQMPTQAQLKCESGPLLMMRRPPGFTPLRNLMTEAGSTQASATEESSEEDATSPGVAVDAVNNNPFHCPSMPWKPSNPEAPTEAAFSDKDLLG